VEFGLAIVAACKSGFEPTLVVGDYTDEEPTADSEFLVYIARR
jgi:hypothetical protein